MSNTLSYIFAAASILIAGAVVTLVSHVRKAIDSRIVASALSLLTTHAGTLVLAAMDEVRTLKSNPGAWTAADASRVKGRVLEELRTLGARDIEVLSDLGGYSDTSLVTLLDKLVEEQVEVLRAQAKPTSTVNVLVPPADTEAPAAQ